MWAGEALGGVQATAEGVQAELARQGMSQRELARRLGWPKDRVHYWLQPGRAWPLEYAKQAAAVLGVPMIIGAGLSASQG